jgi:hypothetical protein
VKYREVRRKLEHAHACMLRFCLNMPDDRPQEMISVCVDLLGNGTVQAVLTDRPVLSWMVTNYQLPNAYVSPILGRNPFSFVYASGSRLRPYVNPSVISAQTETQWIPLADAIVSRYFSTAGDNTVMVVETQVRARARARARDASVCALRISRASGAPARSCTWARWWRRARCLRSQSALRCSTASAGLA